MAALIVFGQRISLAPTVLGYIYHELGEAASHPDHPGKANTIFPSHYIIGCLEELFSSLYRRCQDSGCPGDFTSLVYYAGLLGSKLSLPQLDTFAGMGDIFLSKLALIVRTLVMAGDVIDIGLPMRILNFSYLLGHLYFLHVLELNYF